MKRCSLLILSLLSGFVFAEDTKNKKPNILWLFCDDMAVNAIGAYGSRFADMNFTQNIDGLARDGMRFDKTYVCNSVCAPSRAALLTGKHSHKNGKYGNVEKFNHDQMQFQKLIGKGGYQSALFGKTHLQGEIQGFDHWETLPGHGKYINPALLTVEGKVNHEGHSSDVITNRALEWYNEKRDKDKPFMLMVHYKAPHRAWIPAPRFVEKFKNTVFPEPETLFDDYKTRDMAVQHSMGIREHMNLEKDLKTNIWEHRKYLLNKDLSKEELTRQKYQAYMRDYFACVAGVDENVGRLLDQLKADGIDDNTIVMFSSDQGFYLGEHGWFDKRWMYEESFRTPYIVKWPGVTKPGSVNTDLCQNIDFAETFLDIAGVEAPSDMQGESLVPLFEGETPKDWRKSLYYHYYMEGHGVTMHDGVSTGDYKLIKFYGKKAKGKDHWEFYDLKNDPAEMNNLYNNPEMASKIKEMKEEYASIRDYYEVPDERVVMVKRDKSKKNKK